MCQTCNEYLKNYTIKSRIKKNVSHVEPNLFYRFINLICCDTYKEILHLLIIYIYYNNTVIIRIIKWF